MADIIKTEGFDSAVLSSEKPVLVDFFATWCGPCKMLAPVLEEVEAEHPEITFYKLDVDESPEIANRYGVMSIPTLILFKNGEEVNKSVGYSPKEDIEEFLA